MYVLLYFITDNIAGRFPLSICLGGLGERHEVPSGIRGSAPAGKKWYIYLS